MQTCLRSEPSFEWNSQPLVGKYPARPLQMQKLNPIHYFDTFDNLIVKHKTLFVAHVLSTSKMHIMSRAKPSLVEPARSLCSPFYFTLWYLKWNAKVNAAVRLLPPTLIITTTDNVVSALCFIWDRPISLTRGQELIYAVMLINGVMAIPYLQPNFFPAHPRSSMRKPELGRFHLTCSNYNIVYVCLSDISYPNCHW
jgi:hypothetical protein